MKITLINPPAKHTIQSWQPKALEEGLDFLPPLGLMYLAGYLEQRSSHQVEILDAQVNQLSYSQLAESIQQKAPDVVGITAMTFTLVDVMETARLVKKINPATKVVLGGPHVIIYPEETMQNLDIDFLILGEGEEPFRQLLENIGQPEKLAATKNLVFRQGEKIINNQQTDFIQNLDALPFPARHLTPYQKYFSVLSANRPVTTMFTSRGCPYKCVFCDRPHLGKMFRARSAQNVVEEMKQCQQMDIREIFIYDDTFAVDRQRVLDICEGIQEQKIKLAWDIRTRVNTVDREVLTALKKAGCQRIHYGVEAGTQRILNLLKKGITLEQVKKAFALTKKLGIQTVGYFMIGSPTETKKDILQTIKLMKKLNPDYVHIAITTPFPATELYTWAKQERVITSDPWQGFSRHPNSRFVPPVWEKELSRQQLNTLLKKAYRSFYFSPGFILKQIAKLKSPREFLNKAKAALKLLKI